MNLINLENFQEWQDEKEQQKDCLYFHREGREGMLPGSYEVIETE
jgi:hypothetical protein